LAETPPSGQDFNQGKKLPTSLPIIVLVGATTPFEPPGASDFYDRAKSMPRSAPLYRGIRHITRYPRLD
jgi:hypothetical protein